jgi:hypothetical protein
MAPPPITEHISGPSGGTYTTGDANVPGAPTWVGNASEQITIALDTNSNGSDVEYCIKVEVNGVDGGNIVQIDGTVDTTADVWRTAAQWGSTTAITGLSSSTSPLPYRFAAKARNVDGTPTAYSAWSEIMIPWVDLAYSEPSTAVSYECTTGDCKVSGLTVTSLGDAYPGQYTITYTLTRVHNTSTKNNVKIYYSTDDSTYTLLTGTVTSYGSTDSQFDITISDGYSTTYTYDGTGTAPLFVTNGVTAGMMMTINSSTFNSANNGIFRVLAVTETYITLENRAGVAETNKVLSAATSITKCGAGSIGGDITTLTASSSGITNTNKFASCVVFGNSYHATVYIRVEPYDEATGGDAGDPMDTTVAIDNRPKSITLAEFSSFTWDKDTTPEFVATMGSIVCGSYLYFVCTIYNSSGAIVQTNNSAERTAGWYYEQVVGAGSAVRHNETGWDTGWNACTYTGVPAQYVYPSMETGNRVRYIMQTALTQGQTYTAKIQQAEIRNELI